MNKSILEVMEKTDRLTLELEQDHPTLDNTGHLRNCQ